MKTVNDDIFSLLKSTGYSVNAYDSDVKDGDSVNYVLIPESSDGIKEQYRLEITVIAFDFITGMKMLDDVKKALITVGDTPKTDVILSIALNGGGNLVNYETHTHHLKAYFNILAKAR